MNEPCEECKKRQVKCLLSVGQTWGRKHKVVLNLAEEQNTGLSSKKKTQVALPQRLGNSEAKVNEWRQCIVDVLEIVNVECHAARTQLEGL